MELIELSMRILSFSFLLTVTGVSNSSLLLLGEKGDGEVYKRGRERERVKREGERGRGLQERRESKAWSNLKNEKKTEKLARCSVKGEAVGCRRRAVLSIHKCLWNSLATIIHLFLGVAV